MSIDDWVAQQQGTQVTLSAEKMGLSDKEFDREMQLVEAAGGGVGYDLVKVHRESETGAQLIDLVFVRKVS